MFTKNKRFGLDLIRIIASFLVFIPHIIINFSTDLSIINNAYLISVIGVELFFCLSGYLICRQGVYIVNSKKNYINNTFIFIIRRVLRTWPTYFFALLCYTIFYGFYEKEIIYYLFFIQNFFYPMVSNTFFAVSWSICVEELFYLIFPILLCLLLCLYRKVSSKSINSALLIIVVCIIIIIIVSLIRENITYYNWGSEVRRVALFRVDAIAFGGVGYFIVYFLYRYKYLNIILFSLALLSAAIIFYYLKKYQIDSNFVHIKVLSNYIFYYMYLFSICIIGLFDRLFIISKICIKNFISELAYWAYPLYLMHILIIDLIKNIGIESLVVKIFIIIVLNFLCAFIIRKYIELPFIKARPKYL